MKNWSDHDTIPSNRAPRPRQPRRFLPIALTALCLLLPYIFFKPGSISLWLSTSSRAPVDYNFEWSSIDATEDFHFHKCYDGFECAKLKVPLDYFNGTYPDQFVSIAIAKLPARVPVDDPRYGGPVLINPGGPGGSGVGFALGFANQIQAVIDAPDAPDAASEEPAKYFDILGFDPRGIGRTEPAATCMPDGPSSWSWSLRRSSQGLLDSSDAALGRLWAMEHAFGDACKQALDEEDAADIKQYLATASVARDMLEITEKHAKFSNQSTSHNEPAKLLYVGYSYGTYLGYTFASMFPDRVGRLVLDGVVNSDDYNESLGGGGLVDAEKAMRSFYTYCVHSGPDKCPLATSTSTAKDVEQRVGAIVKSLYHRPIALHTAEGPEILTYSDIKIVLFGSLYSPIALFPFVAQLLAAVEVGQGQILEQYVSAMRPQHIYQCPSNGSMQLPYSSGVPQIAILCSDGEEQTGDSIDAFEKYWHELSEISPTSGSIWATLRLACESWKIRAVHRYSGSFGAENTSHPILFVGNTADPVTPLKSAKIMSGRFPGSVVLTQDSAGHCSIAEPAPCTFSHIRNYFQKGLLPPPNTFCIPPHSSFSLDSTDPKSPSFDEDLARDILGVTGDLDSIEHAHVSMIVKNEQSEPEFQGETWDEVQKLRGFADRNPWWPTEGREAMARLLENV